MRALLARGADATLIGPGTGANAAAASSSSSSSTSTAAAAPPAPSPNAIVGIPPLCRAAASGEAECVRLLIAAGADATSAGPTAEATVGPPLFWAAGSGDGGGEIIKLLLEAGAGADALTADGMSALELACACGHADVAAELLHWSGKTFAGSHEATECGPLLCAALSGDAECVRVLRAHGAGGELPSLVEAAERLHGGDVGLRALL